MLVPDQMLKRGLTALRMQQRYWLHQFPITWSHITSIALVSLSIPQASSMPPNDVGNCSGPYASLFEGLGQHLTRSTSLWRQRTCKGSRGTFSKIASGNEGAIHVCNIAIHRHRYIHAHIHTLSDKYVHVHVYLVVSGTFCTFLPSGSRQRTRVLSF